MNRILNVVCAVGATVAVAGCTDFESATGLNPDGPPMLQQVRLTENVTSPGSTTVIPRRVFAFGTHPMALEGEQHAVTAASATGQALRIIMDELLVGNYLEEIACRAPIDDDAYGRVPVGATPDDIAKCSVAKDVLPTTCKGPKAVCLCDLDAGCGAGADLTPKGMPVGVLDINQDGSADDTRMIKGAVAFKCGAVDVPISLDMSYWNPSGNQQPPAMGGFEAMGPAIVLTPTNGLPTNIECGLTFSPDVVDKQNIQVCAPPNGDITQDCTPGDTSAFKFKVEPLLISPATFEDNMTGVSRVDPAILSANAPLDPASVGGITVTEGAGTNYTMFTAAVGTGMMNKTISITWTAVAGLAPSTKYTITIPISVKDTFGQPLPAPVVVSFTTGT